MKKTNYKILLIITIIFCTFFINILYVNAQNNTTDSRCVSLCEDECTNTTSTQIELIACKNMCPRKCENSNITSCVDKCNSNNVLSNEAYDQCIKTCEESDINKYDNNSYYSTVDNIPIDCADYEIFNKIWKIIVIGAPFLTIALGIMDLIKMVVASDMKETQKLKKNLITRIVALVLLILTPIIVYVILTTFKLGGKRDYFGTMRCIVVGK